MTKTLKLPAEDLNKLTQYEASIAHWSNEYTVLNLKARKMLDAIDNLYIARQKTLDDFLKQSDIDPSSIESLNMTQEGEVHVVLKSKE